MHLFTLNCQIIFIMKPARNNMQIILRIKERDQPVESAVEEEEKSKALARELI